ncbi:polysaccharide biosynthesis protein [Lactiplantibacillus plantarum]|nr:polysaccharide biosynthesis protein [Lactiplantibacillus plantarum]
MFAMRISKSEKEKLKYLYRDLGLDLSTAVNIFFRQSLAENGLPFRPKRTGKNEDSNMVSSNSKVVDDK